MQPTDRICRYVGRNGVPEGADHSNVFDDTVHAATLKDALALATVLLIDDPLSFPWNSIDPDLVQVLVIDTRTSTADDLVALTPVLCWVTPVDTILDPPESIAPLSADLQSRSSVPVEDEWDGLYDQKQLHRRDLSIRNFAEAEIGKHVILHRISITDLSESGQGMADHLADLGEQSSGELVGIWGVRTEPGAPLHHGWAAFEPKEAAT